MSSPTATVHNCSHPKFFLWLWLLLQLFCGLAPAAINTQDQTFELPWGDSWLADVGIYRVFWQAYGQAPIEMPISWSGEFEPRAGISFQDKGDILNRRALLMHSPWRSKVGKTWVDYDFTLPKSESIRLKFGIAMDRDQEGNVRGDGVTFSCYLTGNRRQQELLRKHYAGSDWLDFDFDLTPYAGKTVGIRLQVEPGPQNDPAFDFALFGDARIVIGTDETRQREIVRQMTATKAYRATAATALTNLGNRDHQGIVPGNLLSHKNGLEKSGNSWEFTYRGDDCRIIYKWTPESGTLDDFLVQVDNARTFARHGEEA